MQPKWSGPGNEPSTQTALIGFTRTLLIFLVLVLPGTAAIIPSFPTFQLVNDNADGAVDIAPGGVSFALTGGNNGSGLPGFTTFAGFSTEAGALSFNYQYDTLDPDPKFDIAGYLINGNLFQLADTSPSSGMLTLMLLAGDKYGFFVNTMDNGGEPGVLSVSVSSAGAVASIPEPSSGSLLVFFASAACLIGVRRYQTLFRSLYRNVMVLIMIWLGLCTTTQTYAQVQNHYIGSSITGQLSLARTISLRSFTPRASLARRGTASLDSFAATNRTGREMPYLHAQFQRPPFFRVAPDLSKMPRSTPGGVTRIPLAPSARASVQTSDLAVGGLASGFGFQGVSHFDQRNANSGNQFSVEPPNPSIAVANGMVLEGVNNAVRVFDAASGAPLVRPISSNELFGVSPAIDRSNGNNGVYPTDMRVFYDTDINRWFVVQRSQDNDIFGTPLDQSHLYIAISQTNDPTGAYNIYVMDTTNAAHQGCPCVPDFPQIGADQYGFYVSANEYNTSSLQFIDAQILAISKLSLAAGVLSPATHRFLVPRVTGFEFTIHPATTPKGANQYLANGGVQFFVSHQSFISTDNHLSVWALSNTASLQATNPSPLLTQTVVTTLTYTYPDIAVQRPGPRPYGSSLSPPAPIAFLDGGLDSRILSVAYAGGRLFATLASQVSDDSGRNLVGGAYFILSPTLRGGVLGATVVGQGLLSTPKNNILRPAIAVDARGRGAIAFTLAGPDYYPSAAYTAVDTVSSPSAILIAGAGAGPEDGFTGYPGGIFPGIARWGDYSTATVGSDGSIWMVSEYISGGPRTELANWSTYVSQYVP